ncbi:MAG: RNA 2',3'-cyclic phosphodiesterase [Burkholderiales bacterium]|nr:RNA 2',3'-cyclic phosphodiesterase [Phycisphaerae bacterium]
MPHEQLLRLFLAIDLPEQQRSALGRLQTRLRPIYNGGTYAEPENLPITLHFLGDTAVSRLPDLIDAFYEIEMPYLTLRFDQLIYLPGADRARVSAVGVEGDVALLIDLHARMGEVVKACGFRLDHRKYLPHITLVRFKFPPRVECIPEAARATQSVLDAAPPFRAGQFTLYQSTFDAKAGRYAPLGRFPRQAIR